MARTKPLPHADIGAISTLHDPVRARLYAAVRQAGEPVTREDAAAQAGISRKLAAFHLEKLVDAGLLESRVDERVPRRVGPLVERQPVDEQGHRGLKPRTRGQA